ncbi:MAG: DUF364 domain-containing protein [Anaerolineae bacterium]|nr:DUF364 domain-containing protein [Anaerolineae bacterium]
MPSDLSEALLASIPDGKVLDVRIGLSWTAVVVEIAGARRCGLAATLRGERGHGSPTMPDAGHLVERSARELAIWASPDTGNLTQTSVGFATLNALLAAAAADQQWTDLNAAEVIAERGVGKRVALVGHFPFVEQLREQVGALWVLELQPQPGDLPASAAAEILPQADIIAVTATTLINGTFAGLMALANPVALTMLLGPSTPLSPVLFDHGVDILSGALVQDIDATLRRGQPGRRVSPDPSPGVRLVSRWAETGKSAGAR